MKEQTKQPTCDQFGQRYESLCLLLYLRCLKKRDLQATVCIGSNSSPELKYSDKAKFRFEEELDYRGVPDSPKDFYNSEDYDEIPETELFSTTPRPTGMNFRILNFWENFFAEIFTSNFGSRILGAAGWLEFLVVFCPFWPPEVSIGTKLCNQIVPFNRTYSTIYILVPIETSSGHNGPKTTKNSNRLAAPSILNPSSTTETSRKNVVNWQWRCELPETSYLHTTRGIIMFDQSQKILAVLKGVSLWPGKWNFGLLW